MEPSATFAFNESFDSTLFDLSGIIWPEHETFYGSFFESHSDGIQETAYSFQEPAFGASDNIGFIDSMNRLEIGMRQSTMLVLPLSITHTLHSQSLVGRNDTREVFGEAVSDISRLSRLREGENKQEAYLPFNSCGVRRQRTPYSLPSSSTQLGGASTSTSTPGCVRSRVLKHHSAQPRNQPATTDQVDEILVLLDRGNFSGHAKDLICPVIGCPHQQLNGRIQDFRRHLGTHLRRNGEIRCKGMPWEQFLRDRHLFPKISKEERPYEVPEEGGLWIGGCMKTFSRADALKRHLRKTSCEGYNPGGYIVPPSHT
jgi:hypothetical protein